MSEQSQDTVLTEGMNLYRRKQYEDALAAFLNISSKDPEVNFDLAYYIGLCYASLLQYDDALVYLEQIITAGTDIARVYQCRLILAFIYTKTGRPRLAEFELSKLLDSGYESPQVHTAMAYLDYARGNTEKATELYEKALQLDPENATALNGLGYILADSEKDLTRALILCKKAIDAQPENPAYLDSLAWTYYKMGFDTEARSYIQRADEQLSGNEIIEEHLQTILTKRRS